MTRILFICHGNICRSPAAELILRDLIHRVGLSDEYEISSAATTTEEIGNGVYPPMRRLLTEKGLDCSDFAARQITRSDYDAYDLIIGMDEENRWDARRIFHGDPDGKYHNLLEYVGRPDDSIADPWYTRDFSGSLAEIEESCFALMQQLTGTVFLDFSSCADIPALYEELRSKMDWEDWYGENLDALYDILTGLPHKGRRFILTMPADDAPAEVRIVAQRIRRTFELAGVPVLDPVPRETEDSRIWE
ncbi:MAG: barstar family protein [Oscillospiraceae bacterium]|nr:barstar family protein [Oscillospiraceae bacterium]